MIRELNPSLSIIILNTVVWTLSWQKLAPEPVNAEDKIDPFGQFAWLENRLSKLRDQGKKVFVTGHIPPMLQSFTGSLGQPLYLTEQQQRMDDIIVSYSDVVAALLVAHVHSNELRYNSRYADDAPPLLIAGSLSPCYTTNPVFRVVKYDSGGSQSPIDIATFSADVSQNISAALVSNPFTDIISSLIDYIGMSSLTNKETLKLANKMLPGSDDQNQGVWENYFNIWYKGVPQTACETESCQRAEACLVGCGFLEDEWQKCNSSGLTSIEDACGYTKGKGSPSSSQCMTVAWIIKLCTLIACIITFVFL
jgi:sphingomyelin phosphodiesterase acid-like 3